MFTPQKKGWQTPKSGGGGGGLGIGSVSNALMKGKAVSFVDGPPLGSLSGNEERGLLGFGEDGGMKDWRRFKEAGMLDEESMERKDLQALMEKLKRLENEVRNILYHQFDYLLLR